MNSARLIRTVLSSLVSIWCVSISVAQIQLHVDVSTSPLLGSLGGPFSLDFQLISGSGTSVAPNFVSVKNFSFGAGAPLGSSSLFGHAAGALDSMVTLDDAGSATNEFFQAFEPADLLSFDVMLTTHTDLGPNPDAFSFSILDRNLLNLPTTGFGDSLLVVNLRQPVFDMSEVQTFTSTAPSAITVSVSVVGDVSAVPESGTLAAGIAMLALCFFHLKARHSREKTVRATAPRDV